jgi:hypothetical protein
MRNTKPVVRLQRGAPEPNNGRKDSNDSASGVVKIAIRLIAPVNEELRTLIRYRGDLSRMALEALNSVDLKAALLVSVEDMVRDTTISVPPALHGKLKTLADDRESSINVLVNTALAHWLAKKGNIRLI